MSSPRPLVGNQWGLLRLEDHTLAENGASIDIVAVHGFGGDRSRTWSTLWKEVDGFKDDIKPSEAFWVRDFLAVDMREANIYTFGYPSSASINSVAKDLVRSLDDERSHRDNFNTPVVFIAHGTGGLILKQALVMLASQQANTRTRILTSTRTLLFFGVPHRGHSTRLTRRSNAGIKIHNILSSKHIQTLPSKKELLQMLEAFAPISTRFRIYTFYPTISSNSAEHSLRTDAMTYIMGLSNEEVLSINASWIQMVRFSSKDHPGYRQVLSILKRSAGSSFVATQNWHKEQMFRLDGEESESAKQWLTDLQSDAHRVVDSRFITRRSKIAILDSGIDWNHPSFKESVTAGRIVARSFVEGLRGDEDSHGHGTHTAHVALKVAPHSKLFIARVIEDGTQTEFERNTTAIVEAIKWAVSKGVDIISLSLGYRVANDGIKVAIRDAFHKGVIFVAAASNSGANPRFPISFPANMRQVICVHSADGHGNPSPRNPPVTPDCNLSILGEGVAAAWPRDLYTRRDDGLRVASGTSVATAIAAGLAALVIEYAAQEGPEDEVVTRWMQLRHCDEMRKLFDVLGRDRSGYRFIAPSSLFDYHGDQIHQRVASRINDVLDSLNG